MNFGPNIVKDGLWLYLDAANKKSYRGTGTSWLDLSGNNRNTTLTNGPTFNSVNGGAIVFDGVDDYATPNIQQNTDNKSITWEAWFWDNSPGGWGNFSTAIISNYQSGTPPFTVLHINPDGTTFFQQNNSLNTTVSVSSNKNVCDSIWHHLVGVVDSTTMYYYIDANLIGSVGKVTGTTTSGQNLIFAGGHYSRYQSCRLSIIRLYDNKALSASEVLQNYNATKTRFGL